MKTLHRSKFNKGGYAALLTTISLSLTIIAFALIVFRQTRQAHTVQTRNQVRLDYGQKERALLRSLLDIVPNTAMRAMMTDSKDDRLELSWVAIFEEALAQASISQGIDPSVASSLGFSAGFVSGNTGDANFLPENFITSPNGNRNIVMQDNNNVRPSGLDLPPRQSFFGGGAANATAVPIVSLNKRLSRTGGTFTELPYPQIAFGYSEQGSNFIAKRNWWAFTVNFGAESEAITGVAPSPRTYVLSIYEVPSQLAISSEGSSTSLGRHRDGSDWDASQISITGSIYAQSAIIEDTNAVGSVATRNGLQLGNSAPTGQSIGGLVERREQQALTNTFLEYSSSSDSGLVSFTPINRGLDFFDYFADTTLAQRSDSHFTAVSSNSSDRDYLSETYDQNTTNAQNWTHYSVAARQTQIQVEVTETRAPDDQLPTQLSLTARFDGDSVSRRQQASRDDTVNGVSGLWRTEGQASITNPPGQSWTASPTGEEWFLQSQFLPNGKPCITLDLEKLPAFLTRIGADDITVNNSIWIGPNYGTGNVTQSNFPSLDEDMALIITNSTDLSEFTNGLTIITPLRVYYADDFNNTVSTPPAGSGITTDWYPPVSVYAPEKRFGINTNAQGDSTNIQLVGQLGFLPTEGNTATLNPLELQDGADNVDTKSIQAQLESVSQIEDLPPLSSMSWLTIIEEIR